MLVVIQIDSSIFVFYDFFVDTFFFPLFFGAFCDLLSFLFKCIHSVGLSFFYCGFNFDEFLDDKFSRFCLTQQTYENIFTHFNFN